MDRYEPLARLWNSSGTSQADGAHVFALVDHAGAAGLMQRLQGDRSIAWISLFDNSAERRALEVAPILIDLGVASERPKTAVRILLDWLLSTCACSNAVLLLRSTYAHRPLADALARRLNALLPDNMPVMLRYFDTRVFASLLAVLYPEQRRMFLGVATAWWWFDRAGTSHVVPSEPCANDELPVPIPFDEAQQAALIDAADADAVVLQMLRQAPDMCESHTRGALHALVDACLPHARSHGIDDGREQALFCLTALEIGPAFYDQAPWREALQRRRQAGQSLAKLIQEMTT